MSKDRPTIHPLAYGILAVLVASILSGASSSILPMGAAAEQKYPDRYSYEQQANRSLNKEEISKLFDLSHLLIDKNRSLRDRLFAPEKLVVLIGHRNAIPVLLAVLRDEKEDQDLRYRCLSAISRITDKTSIDILIETMTDQDPVIGARAWEQFWKITAQGKRFEIGSNTDLNVRKERAKISATWWAENREDGTIYWGMAFVEF